MTFKKKSKRVLALTICVSALLVFGLAFLGTYILVTSKSPVTEADDPVMEKGVLSGETVYFITNETQLRAIAADKESLGKTYLLNNDIHLTKEWIPIGTADEPFTGAFEGNGNVIWGLTMTAVDSEPAGLFGTAKGATLHNIELRDVMISSVGEDITRRESYPICGNPILTTLEDNRSHAKDKTDLIDEMETLEIDGEQYYLVFNETQLRAIGSGQYSLDKNYMQQEDILMSTDEWIPIGTEKDPFAGSYNGNGYEIKGLTMKNPDVKIIGMFGVAEGADIYNITLRDYDILSAGENAKNKSVGAILAVGKGNTRSYDNKVYPITR